MIDLNNFTPLSSLIGGLIIGFSVILYLYTTGKLAGISGIFANTITNSNNRFANILFLLGLIIGPSIYLLINNANFEITKSIPLIIVGGFLVGFGTKLGSGCTSGHGVCGISRLSVRSIVATLYICHYSHDYSFRITKNRNSLMSQNFFSLLSGIIFGIGLIISGMTNPEKVIGFLRITDNWDPSLMFVMGGAIIFCMHLLCFYLETRKLHYWVMNCKFLQGKTWIKILSLDLHCSVLVGDW